MPWKRCKLTNDTEKKEIILDVLIRSDGTVFPSLQYYGAYRSPMGTWPLIFINDNHAVDLGSDYGSDKDRHGKMVVHGELMQPGCRFDYIDGREVHELTVFSCQDYTGRAD